MPTHEVRIVNTTIDVPFDEAYAFTHQPENFPKWASGLSSSLHRTAAGWEGDTPAGKAIIRFSERNDYGVLDHWLKFAGRPEVYTPLRMIANGDGTEVELVLLRGPDMSDADFAGDAEHVAKDLAALKTLLEDDRRSDPYVP